MCNTEGKDLVLPVIGTFLLFPYLIFGVVCFVLKSLMKADSQTSSEISPEGTV
jgi:hypothetical protein